MGTNPCPRGHQDLLSRGGDTPKSSPQAGGGPCVPQKGPGACDRGRAEAAHTCTHVPPTQLSGGDLGPPTLLGWDYANESPFKSCRPRVPGPGSARRRGGKRGLCDHEGAGGCWRFWGPSWSWVLLSGDPVAVAVAGGQPWRRAAAPFRSWDTGLYRPWQEGTPQQRDCWRGGDVTFDISNDAPTMAGADATFSIALRFPGTQAVLPDGRVVWSQNCTVNGLHPKPPCAPQPAAPASSPSRSPQAPASPKGTPFSRSRRLMVPDGVFPDGEPFPESAWDKREKFVYVWWTWGRYWQVVDGATSRLTVGTAGGGPGLLHHGGCRLPLPRPPEVRPPSAVPAPSSASPDTVTSGTTSGATAGATAASAEGTTTGILVEVTAGATAGDTAASMATVTSGSATGGTSGPTAVPEATAEPLVLVKRQAPADEPTGCVLYRYGTFATQLEIVQGIESVAIVQVVPVTAASGESGVELTVTCEGSPPEEVCTVVADAECQTAQAQTCSAVAAAPGCHLVLRQDFNGSGVFCLNVSLANANGLAVASARVAVGGDVPAAGRTTLVVGLVLIAAALGTAAYTYR
ncbi:Pmel [Columba livia]|nr:Pmel [Columba livia]